ncbi:hypothetical protein [Winogradskyella flava]|uniref:capsular polysaccharide export protein, LipB/KpsS family n=1 Tax=Winogradskyella flava TaxID=1884876 RepID=UPI00248FBA2E|nr:hypothetical protein [Winogradskyella flava]
MTLLFLENRYKTYFFEPIAQRLKSLGHRIHWIVQNKEFLPSGNFEVHVINYPKGKMDFHKIDYVENIILSDRQVNQFKKQDTSYFYYYNSKIEQILEDINPDFVFGESTAFHELLTIENCKRKGILYLNPSTCRYPVGRFSFYKYDTLEPFLGSGELLSEQEAETTIKQITNRETLPNYMKSVKTSKHRKVGDKIKKVIGYYKGEKYNTPNPFVKYRLENQKERNIHYWNTIAVGHIEKTNEFKVLYPLQMQPEANIDVWGRPFRDQTTLIESISNNLPKHTVLYVKPNPKSKYELTQELIGKVSKKNNVIALKHSTKMDNVLPEMDLVITVTGTIAIECILSNKPVITLVKTINNSAKNCEFIDNLSLDLPKIVSLIRVGKFPKITDEEKISYINLLNKTSFKGVVSDPMSDVNCVGEENIDNICFAFSKTLERAK